MGIPCSIPRIALEYLDKQSSRIEQDIGPDDGVDGDVYSAFGSEDSEIQ